MIARIRRTIQAALHAWRQPTPVVIRIDTSADRSDAEVLQQIRNAIRVRGGDVQTVLGTGCRYPTRTR